MAVSGNTRVRSFTCRNCVLSGFTVFAHDFELLFDWRMKSKFEIDWISYQENQSLGTSLIYIS